MNITHSFPASSVHPVLDDCLQAAEMGASRLWNFIRIFQCFVTSCTLILLCIFLRQFFQHSHLLFHKNLLCFMANIAFLLALHSGGVLFSQLRFLILFTFYEDSCEYLTPVWMGVFIRLLTYVYLFSFSLLHIGITVERARATIFAQNYEKEGRSCGLLGLSIVWVIVVFLCVLLMLTVMGDQIMSKPLVYLTLITPQNQQAMIYVHYVLLVLVVYTATADYIIIVQNRKYLKKMEEYSLSQSYQLNENIITMRLILPLDISYALLFFTYVTFGVYLRCSKYQISSLTFFAFYDLDNCLLIIHSLASCLFYWHFNNNKQKHRLVDIKPVNQHASLYFSHLKTIWI